MSEVFPTAKTDTVDRIIARKQGETWNLAKTEQTIVLRMQNSTEFDKTSMEISQESGYDHKCKR